MEVKYSLIEPVSKFQSLIPFWLMNSGLMANYTKLEKSIKTDTVIIGGGISGALAAYFLVNAGIKCTLVDARSIGLSSTSASTSLLQYELDKSLSDLSSLIGFKNAERAYHLCSEAIDKLENISHKTGFIFFEKQKSLYFAATKKNNDFIKTEFEFRKKAGFDVSLMDEKDIFQKFGFKSPSAILSVQGAVTDAYRFTHTLLQESIKKGLKVFDRTLVTNIKYNKHDAVLTTENGLTITAKKIVNATGYEINEFIDKKIVNLSSTFALASEIIQSHIPVWKEKAMLWNTANPYLYMRLTHDNRIIIGGRDEKFYNPVKRDKLIKKKSEMLHKDFSALFPDIKFNAEYSWAGTFGSTDDSLPYIGTYNKTPHTYYALGFGGNGIVFSLIAAEIIRDMILGKSNKDAHLFSFGR